MEENLSTENLEKEVKHLVAEIVEIEPDQINPDAHLVEDLGMDSMRALEILAALEKKYRIAIPNKELPTITTLNRAIELVKKYRR